MFEGKESFIININKQFNLQNIILFMKEIIDIIVMLLLHNIILAFIGHKPVIFEYISKTSYSPKYEPKK